jgi:tetratricopeptide (TPR) repeat protein
VNWNVGRMLCFDRKYDEAIAELRRTRELLPGNSAVDIWLFKSYWKKGMASEAFAVDSRMHVYRDGLTRESQDALTAAFSKRGLPGYWTKLKELLLPKFRTNPIGWYRLAEIDAYLGDKEDAFDWLQKAQEERPNWIPWLKVDPAMDPLRSDPRFGALLRRMGLEGN